MRSLILHLENSGNNSWMGDEMNQILVLLWKSTKGKKQNYNHSGCRAIADFSGHMKEKRWAVVIFIAQVSIFDTHTNPLHVDCLQPLRVIS